MKDVFTIHQADNGIMLKSDKHAEVIEYITDVNNVDRNKLYLNFGKFIYSIIKSTTERQIAQTLRVELNITKEE